jgi:hypothetical protein
VTVIQLDIMAADDPLGTPLVTLTDEDLADFSMRVAENSLGAGSFTIRRDHAAATPANLAEDNYVKVTIPAIDDDPVFGFFLEHHDDTVLAQGEEGAETLVRQGPGSLAIVGRAAFLDDHYAPVPPASDDRGSPNEIEGYWRWQHKQYGQIFKRLIEEGQNEPGVPLADVTTDFDRDVDSDGTDWPAIDRDVRFEIGTDGLTFMDRFAETGEVFIRCSPELLVSARQNRGTDRTSSSFAPGKVRLVKGVNIQTELVRSADTTMAATHAIVIGMENNVVRVVSPSYTSGPGKWVTIHYDNSNDTGVLEKVGAEALRRGVADLQELTLEIRAGDAPLSGHYLPFKHFDTGDLITVHTGTDPNDYNEQTERVKAFTIALGDASDDTMHGSISGDEMAARSLIVGVECGGAAGSFGIDINVKVDEKGCGGCPEPGPWQGCDDVSLQLTTHDGQDRLSCIFSSHANGQSCASSDYVTLYDACTYRFDYYCHHAPGPDPVGSNGLELTIGDLFGGQIGVPGAVGVSQGLSNPAMAMGDIRGPDGCTFNPPSDIPFATTNFLMSGRGASAPFNLRFIEASCTSGDSYGASGELVVTYLDGPDPRFEDLDPCPGGFPVAGQPVEQTFNGDGTTTSFTTPGAPVTPLPYRPETIHLSVDGLDWTSLLTETDPATGDYELAYPIPVGSEAFLWFVMV